MIGAKASIALRMIRLAPVLLFAVGARPAGVPPFTVVNMIPAGQADDIEGNPEPSLSVSLAVPRLVIASSWISGTEYCHTNAAALFVSLDDGNTWNVSCAVPTGTTSVPADVTVRISGDGKTLFASSLGVTSQGGVLAYGASVYGISPGAGGTVDALFQPGVDPASLGKPLYWRATTDQPQLAPPPAGSASMPWIGNHRDPAAGVIDHCSYVTVIDNVFPGPPAATCLAEDRPPMSTSNPGRTLGQIPAARIASARGTTYVVMYRTVSKNVYDVVVYRRDGGKFDVIRDIDLTSAVSHMAAALSMADCSKRDTLPGFRLARCVSYPYLANGIGATGQESRKASELSIAVNPTNPDKVYVAWAEQSNTTIPSAPLPAQPLQLRFAQSADGGRTWTTSSWTYDQATNPALAVAADSVIGILFQQLVTVGPGQTHWQTQFATTTDFATKPATIVLADVDASQPVTATNPYIGDYIELQSLGRRFYGVFSASNATVNRTTFPWLCQAACPGQRPYNLSGQPVGLNGLPVASSIDPFFVRVER
jgi:hypothetical protein